MTVLWILLLFSAAIACADDSGGKTYGQRFAYHYEIPMNGNEKPKVEYAYAELGDPEAESEKTAFTKPPSPRRSPPNRFPPPPFPFALPYQYPDTNKTFFDSMSSSPEPANPRRTHMHRSPKTSPSFAPPPERENDRDHENSIDQRYASGEDAAERTAKTLQDIQYRINQLMADIGSQADYPPYGGTYEGNANRNYGPFGGTGFGFGGDGIDDFGGFRNNGFRGDDYGRSGFPPFFSNRNNRNRRRSSPPHNPAVVGNWFWTN